MKIRRLTCLFTPIMIFGLAIFQEPIFAQGNKKKTKLEQPYSVPMKIVLRMLTQSEIQKELELDTAQIRKVKTYANQYPHEVQAEWMKIQPLPITREEESDEQMKEVEEARKERVLEIDNDYATKLEEVLLPFQRKRIGQMGVQLLYAKPVLVSVFKSKEVAKLADLNESQSRELSRVATQAELDYLKELKELKLKYHQQVRDSFSPEVRAAVQEILGDPYITVPEPEKAKEK